MISFPFFPFKQMYVSTGSKMCPGFGWHFHFGVRVSVSNERWIQRTSSPASGRWSRRYRILRLILLRGKISEFEHWLLSSLLTLTSSFSLHTLTHFTRSHPHSLRKLRFSSDLSSVEKRKHPVLDSFLSSLSDLISLLLLYPFLFRSILHSSNFLLFLISYRIPYRVCDLEWRQILI